MPNFTITVEVAFNAGFSTAAASRTWTDVSAYVKHAQGVGVDWGRSDALTNGEPSTLTLTFNNSDGRFTAGNTSSPYYPNVKLDRPIRVTVTPDGGSASVRFTGYINEWPVSWPAVVATYAETTITATSRTGRLGLRNAMQAMVIEDALTTSAVAIYPLSDPSGSTYAEDVSGNDAAPLATAGGGEPLSFGGSGVEFVGGQYLVGGTAIDLTTAPAGSWACTFVATTSGSGVADTTLLTTDTVTLWGACRILRTELEEFTDGHPHRFVVTRSSGGTVTAKIDDTAITSPTLTGTVGQVAGQSFVGNLRDLTYWSSELTSAQVSDDFVAFNGGYGEVSDVALERIAVYIGIPSAEVDADAGVVVMGGIDTAGMAAVDALRVVETTEGGVLIDDRDGDLRLIGRRARYHSAAALTLDVAAGEVTPNYQPTLDRALLRNDVTGTNAASSIGSVDSGSTVSQRAKNQASIDEYGTVATSVEVASASADEPYAAASWIVANHGEPSPRAPALEVRMSQLSASDKAAALAATSGTRVTVTNRLSQDSSAEADFFIEGGSESWTPIDGILTWNVSPVGLEDSILVIDDAVLGQLDAGNYFGY